MSDWPFDQTPSTAAITLRSIMNDGQAILYVSHDLDDHSWQFLGLGEPDEKEAMLVSMQDIVNLDPSVIEVADIAPGWQAWRTGIDAPWQRSAQS